MKLFRKQKPVVASRRQVQHSVRPSVFSYHANRAEQEVNLGRMQPRNQDGRHRERLVRYWRQRLGMLFAGLVLVVCVLAVLRVTPNAKVLPLGDTSHEAFLQSSVTYQTAANKLLRDSPLNSNKVTIDTDTMQAKMRQQFPELADVSVTLPLVGHRPIVYIAPNAPGVLLKTAAGDYILDDTGRALLTASQVGDLNENKLPVVIDTSINSVTTGKILLPGSTVKFIQIVYQELQAKGIAIDTMTLPPAAYELDVKPKGEGYVVKFNVHDTNAMQQVGTYLAVRQRLQSTKVTPSAYIDVRLGGRAYYK